LAVTQTNTLADASLLKSLKLHLEGLKRTEHGLILYNQISRGLEKYGHEDGRIELIFVSFMHALLGKYATSQACDPATRVKARLIQQRLTLYMPKSAPKAVVPDQTALQRAATPKATPPQEVRPQAQPQSPSPPTPVAPPPVEVVAKAPPPEPAPRPAPAPAPEPIAKEVQTPKPTEQTKPEPIPEPIAEPVIAAKPTAPTRQENIEVLEDTLAQNVTESIAVDQQFGELLESERDTLKNLDSPLNGFSELKEILVKGLNELIEERHALIEKLASAGDYLKAVEVDRQRLHHELSHARKHSMADELTGLPKRDVFVKQLEAEIGRVKRYGFSLAVAVIDVDNLESVNKRYGREAGDAVLRIYASQILSKFRTYDLVARYGGDEFAVLFPNTQKDGAMHALEKARKSAASTFLQQEGKNIPLPSFSSVLTQYSPGELASTLLQRADQTLTQARLSGYNRMVVALPSS